MAVTGLRGTGKTVLLGELARLATAGGWLVGRVETTPLSTLRQAIAEALHPRLASLALHQPDAAVRRALRTAQSYFRGTHDTAETWAFPVDLSDVPEGGGGSGHLERDLNALVTDLTSAMAGRRRGVALLVDEAQDLTADELAALCHLAVLAAREEKPLLLCLAGLPNLPTQVGRVAPATETLFVHDHLGALTREQSGEVLQVTARAAGGRFRPDALALLVDHAQGNPYFLQQLGQEAWNVAAEQDITLREAQQAVPRAHAVLDRGFFQIRWDRASRTEQKYLRTMAMDGQEGSSTTQVAERLGTTTKAIGTIRARLITKGLIYTPSYGRVAFTVPGMADFIARRPQD